MAPRLSLTKAQLQTAAGAELLELCQSVTADGVLSNSEIVELRNWFVANRSSDLPAIGFLVSTLQRILADGKVTQEEREELYRAIETVLPPEVRRGAVNARKQVEAAGKAVAKAAEQAAKDLHKRVQQEEALRRKPICSESFMVAGVRHEGRSEIIHDYVDEGVLVFLVREPDNEFDRNAIAVVLANGLTIGYVPREFAEHLASLFDEGWPHKAFVRKMLVETRFPIPVVQLYLHRHDSGVEGCVYAKDAPPRRPYFPRQTEYPGKQRARPAKAAKGGCVSVVFMAVSLVCLAVAVFR